MSCAPETSALNTKKVITPGKNEIQTPQKKATASLPKPILPAYYIVQKNDCLFKIARRLYNRQSLWATIYLENKAQIKNPQKIYPNQKLRLPF